MDNASDGEQGNGRARDFDAPRSPRLARVGVADTARIMSGVLAPLIAEGVVARRKTMVRVGGRLHTHRRAAAILDQMRSRHPDVDAVRLSLPRATVLALRPAAVEATLSGTPQPFTPASREKRAALSHFQPTGVLISDQADRPARRQLNEHALETDSPRHSLHDRFSAVVEAEIAYLLDTVRSGRITWDLFVAAHWRIVRQIMFGDAARDDHEFTDVLTMLRRDANWAYARPQRRGVYAHFRRRLETLVAAAPDDSLAAAIRDSATQDQDVDPIGQIPHWLFAFDAVAVATYRALALIAAHTDTAAKVRGEIRAVDSGDSVDTPTLRSTVLESLRLWPTTLAILRETDRNVAWTGGALPKRCTTVIISQYFQRDPEAIDFADRFSPDSWVDGRFRDVIGVVPFSAGAGACPGRDVVLQLSSLVLTGLCRHFDLDDDVLTRRVRAGQRDMPHELDHFDLVITLSRHHSIDQGGAR